MYDKYTCLRVPFPPPSFTCSELGKITLDKTFEERETLNQAIVANINEAAAAWGLRVLRYEIKDITPPQGIIQVGFMVLRSGLRVLGRGL